MAAAQEERGGGAREAKALRPGAPWIHDPGLSPANDARLMGVPDDEKIGCGANGVRQARVAQIMEKEDLESFELQPAELGELAERRGAIVVAADGDGGSDGFERLQRRLFHDVAGDEDLIDPAEHRRQERVEASVQVGDEAEAHGPRLPPGAAERKPPGLDRRRDCADKAGMAEEEELEGPRWRCGGCKAYVFDVRDARTQLVWGHCFVNPRSGSVGAHEPACPSFEPAPGQTFLQAPVVAPRSMPVPSRPRPRAPRGPEPVRVRLAEIPLEGEGEAMDREELKSVLAEVLDETLGLSDSPIHNRFRGGKVIIQPADPSLQSKELPIDVLFRKVIAIRDKLRVLEQRVNSSEGIDTQDKVQIQSYISACYGTLTSFNFLFRDKEDSFSSK
jgi:hypothetical protein